MTRLTEKIKVSNFSFRLEDDLRNELKRISKKIGVSSANLVRNAAADFVYKFQVEEELELLRNTELEMLPLLLNSFRTKEGNEELKRRFTEAIDIRKKTD